ncbi:MAG: aminopeptidase P family protein [Burkholderiales bacterium]|nr:aminopeptidase P family protein [Burkholderiales bacterium]
MDGNAPTIPKSEFARRRGALAQACAGAGLDAIVTWSRDSTIADRAGYSIYLGNYQTKFFSSFFDFPPHFACRGHSAVVVPAKGQAALIKDYPTRTEVPELADRLPTALVDRAGLAIDEVRFDYNVIGGVAAMLGQAGLGQGRLGLVGSGVLSAKHLRALEQALPGVEWVPADELLDSQMRIKSPAELEVIRYACAAVDSALDRAFLSASVGIAERDLAFRVACDLADQGCEVCWVRPNTSRRLAAGDIYSMAVVGWYQGYIFDVTRSRVIGGSPSAQQSRLLDLVNEFVLRQVDELQPGRTAGEAAKFGCHYFIDEKREFSRADFEAGILGTFAAFGHGLGLGWERPILREEEDIVLRPGMFLAVEAAYRKPEVGFVEAEVNVEITENGPRLLTRL